MGRTRDATDTDIAELVRLVESAYRGDASRRGWDSEADLIDGQRIDADMLAATLARPDVAVLVLEDTTGPGGPATIVACCELVGPATPGDAVTLGMVAVEPGLQDRGLGRQLLAEAERVARRRWRARRLRITVIDLRTALIAWYERRGFRRTGDHLPFPYGDERFGVPRRDDLRFAVLEKDI